MKELQILSADGKSGHVPLVEGKRITIGRSSASEFSFPDDNGLSRQHLAIEFEDGAWTLRDLGSKNGTILNGLKVTAPMPLKTGDRIVAGHLIVICGASPATATKPVVIFDPLEEEEVHIDWLEAQLDQIKQMGPQNYLVEQIH